MNTLNFNSSGSKSKKPRGPSFTVLDEASSLSLHPILGDLLGFLQEQWFLNARFFGDAEDWLSSLQSKTFCS